MRAIIPESWCKNIDSPAAEPLIVRRAGVRNECVRVVAVVRYGIRTPVVQPVGEPPASQPARAVTALTVRTVRNPIKS